MKRFTAFTEEQGRQLVKARRNDVERVLAVVAMLIVALALGFGYGLKLVSDASDRADAANKGFVAFNRQRAAEAKQQAEAAKEQSQKAALDAYASCRRQQHSTIAQLKGLHVLLLIPDPAVHAAALHYQHYLEAQHLLDVPLCTKPPEGSG